MLSESAAVTEELTETPVHASLSLATLSTRECNFPHPEQGDTAFSDTGSAFQLKVKKISEDAPKLSFIDSSPLLLPKKILEN